MITAKTLLSKIYAKPMIASSNRRMASKIAAHLSPAAGCENSYLHIGQVLAEASTFIAQPGQSFSFMRISKFSWISSGIRK